MERIPALETSRSKPCSSRFNVSKWYTRMTNAASNIFPKGVAYPAYFARNELALFCSRRWPL
jgi:hypothetical protein